MDAKDRGRVERPSAPPFKRARAIVVVEADQISSEFLRSAVRRCGFEIVWVATIEGALREVRATAAVVAVVDDDLPLVRGLDLVGRLRAERPDMESVLMTRDEGIAAFAARLTVERFRCLTKPFHLDDLLDSVILGVERLTRRARSAHPETDEARAGSAHEALRRRIEVLERSSQNMSHAPPPTPSTDIEEDIPAEGVLEEAATEEIVGEVVDKDDLHVLIVDDDPLVRNAMARTFKRHHVATAENGRAATKEIERRKPDIIISDLKMPVMDGIELAEEIGVRWPELSSRIVFVSGQTSQIERARKIAPEQPLLTKPVSSQQLEARIVEVLEAAIRRR